MNLKKKKKTPETNKLVQQFCKDTGDSITFLHRNN